MGETLSLSGQVGNLQRNATFGFTQPYLFDRPLNLGFTVFTSRYDYNEAQNYQILTGQKINFSQQQLDVLQNFSNSRTGFTVSASYPLKHSYKRLGITYSLDTQSIQAFSSASQDYFEAINFRGVSGPNSLSGIVTSKVIPSFSFNSIDYPTRPHKGKSFYAAIELSGIGGNVSSIRPVVDYKQFIPVNKGRNVLGFHLSGSFISGYNGKVAPPYERFYMGGENDIRGFDIRSITPYAYVSNSVDVSLRNPDGSFVPASPTNPRVGGTCNLISGETVTPNYKCYNVTVPVNSLTFTGGDTSLVSNIEYRIPIAGPVTLAFFNDFGMDFNLLPSQLQLSDTNFAQLNSQLFGCPQRDPVTQACIGTQQLKFSRDLTLVPGTNYVPRMSTGAELQVILPVVNAPFRIYYAYNPLRLDTSAPGVDQITRSMFPAGGAGDYSYKLAESLYGIQYKLQEPRKTFRFTVSTTF